MQFISKLKQLLHLESTPESDSGESKDIRKEKKSQQSQSGIVKFEDAYLKYENFRFPEIQQADEVYTKEYQRYLNDCISQIFKALPTVPNTQPVSMDICLQGIIYGDMYGSPFECVKEKVSLPYNIQEVPLQNPGVWTDDTIMTIATLRAMSEINEQNATGTEAVKIFAKHYKNLAKKYPYVGYGGKFYDWAIFDEEDPAYTSYGDGSAMRAGIIGAAVSDLKTCIKLSTWSALPTHAHPEGIKGAVCTAVLTYYACHGADKSLLKKIALMFYPHGARTTAEYERADYGYFAPDLTLNEIIEMYPRSLSVTCQVAVPIAISLFLLSGTHIDFLKHLSVIPMDADTVGAIAGGFMAAWNSIHSDNIEPPCPNLQCFQNTTPNQPEEIRQLFMLPDLRPKFVREQDMTENQDAENQEA